MREEDKGGEWREGEEKVSYRKEGGKETRREKDERTVPKFSPWYSATTLSESKTGRVPLDPATTLFENGW